jgi:hypothetical protein
VLLAFRERWSWSVTELIVDPAGTTEATSNDRTARRTSPFFVRPVNRYSPVALLRAPVALS